MYLTYQWGTQMDQTCFYNINNEILTTLTVSRLRLLYVRPVLTFRNSAFFPHSTFMCFVWISERTAIVSLYSINLSVCYNRGREYLQRGTAWVFKSDGYSFFLKSLNYMQFFRCGVFFWVIPRRLSFNGRRFGTLYRFHLHRQLDEL